MEQNELEYNREDRCFGKKDIVIVENHNYVLPAWVKWCSEIGTEIRLITFDYHMDTRPSYSHYAYKKSGGDMAKVNSGIEQVKVYEKYMKDKYNSVNIEEMVTDYVYHDEHISVAYDMEFISDFYCICKQKDDYSQDYKHYFMINDSFESCNLENFCREAQKKKYILDIDLDFFNSEQDFKEYNEIITEMIKGTTMITVAREHHYFEFLSQSVDWSNDKALESLLKLIEENAE